MSTSEKLCPVCAKGQLQERTESRLLEWNGVKAEVEGFKLSICNECESEIAAPDQARDNKRLVLNFRRQHEGMLSGDEIKGLRGKYRLTQSIAAIIFGGGAVAFSKYESGDVIQSGPMDRLLRVASEVPGVLTWLCNRYAVGQKCATTEHVNFYWDEQADIAIVAEGTVAEVSRPRLLRLISSSGHPIEVIGKSSFKKENRENETEPAKLRSLSTA